LRAESFDDKGGTFLLPADPKLVHVGGVICGQATASAADTVSVVTLAAMNGRFRVCTTVDLTTHFIRPLPPGDVEIRCDVLSNGKRMAFVRVEERAKGDARVAVSATMAFAYMEG
jgi:acyl-coenzyme A thioesterase PaaI-like protein